MLGHMSTTYQRIEGHMQVVDAFGYWPVFHDAEVRSLLLDRNAALFEDIADARLDLCLHAFEWTGSNAPAFNHHLVQFRFHEVHELTLEGFNHQNAIYDFTIEDYGKQADAPRELKLTIAGALGLSGSFRARSGQVLSVTPCDKKGRPRQQ